MENLRQWIYRYVALGLLLAGVIGGWWALFPLETQNWLESSGLPPAWIVASVIGGFYLFVGFSVFTFAASLPAPAVTGFDPIAAPSERSFAVAKLEHKLAPVEFIPWRDSDAAERATADLLALGFALVGDFEYGEVYARVFCHEPLHVRGTIVEGKKELRTELNACVNERNINVSDSKDATLEMPQWIQRVGLPGANASELLNRLLAEAGDAPRQPATVAEAINDENIQLQKVREWRVIQGGLQRHELLKVLAKLNKQLTDTEINQHLEKARITNLFQLDQLLRKELANAPIETREQIALAGRTIFIHEQLTLKEAIEMVPRPTRVDLSGYPANASVRESFRQITAKFPAGLQPVLLMKLEQPVPADVYAVSAT